MFSKRWLRKTALLAVVSFVAVVGMSVATADENETTVPTIPDSALLTNVEVRSMDGESLPALMAGIAVSDFQLTEFVTLSDAGTGQCSPFAALGRYISFQLPQVLSVPLSARAFQGCSGCYMNAYSAPCPGEGCTGSYWVGYSTGDCMYCGNGYSPGAVQRCVFSWPWCPIWGDGFCYQPEYCNCENCS
jgi:hypothetical protein